MTLAAAPHAGAPGRPAPPRPLRPHRQIDQLDGVRALAVLAVMSYHDFLTAGGSMGVDVFFVLSGLLITSVLLGEWDRSGDVGLRRFYVRRMLRLAPALLVALVLLTPLGPQLSEDGSWGMWWASVAAAATYTANLDILVHGTQFLGALTPVWSLAVEMQFYLLWPPLLVWLLRRGTSRRALTIGVLVAAAAGLSVFWLDGGRGPEALAVAPSYFRPDARFGELLAGCALALLLARRSRPLSARAERTLSALAVVGLGGLVAAQFVLHASGTVAPLPIVAVSSVLILARLATSDRALLSRVLRVPPLPQIGRISYAMYLWQLPVLTLVGTLAPSAAVQQVLFWGGTLAAGWLSTRFVEQRFLRRKDRLRAGEVADEIGTDARRPGSDGSGAAPQPPGLRDRPAA